MKVSSSREQPMKANAEENPSFDFRQPLLSVLWRPSSQETSSEAQLPRWLVEEGNKSKEEEVPGSTSATVNRIERPGCAVLNSCRR